jgi:endonuclease/exonuclease/phosphatase family metal-dependent hydrolase
VIPEQAEEWAALRAKYPDATLCVAGDYNSDLAEAHVYGTRQGRALIEAGLTGAGLRCVTRTVPGLADAPIDHVSVSGPGQAAVVAAWEGTVDGERLSDHSAVVVDVRGQAGTTA